VSSYRLPDVQPVCMVEHVQVPQSKIPKIPHLALQVAVQACPEHLVAHCDCAVIQQIVLSEIALLMLSFSVTSTWKWFAGPARQWAIIISPMVK